jgi:hypothetical protein
MKFLCALFLLGGAFVQTAMGELLLSLKGPRVHHGGELLLNVTATNSTAAPITFQFPDEPGEISGWLSAHAGELKLIKEGLGEVPPRDLLQFKRKKIPSGPYAEHEIGSHGSFVFQVDLRQAFEFPPGETGKYRLDFLGSRLAFTLPPVPGLVFAAVAAPGGSSLEGTEHAVVRDPKRTHDFLLLARLFNAPFQEIYQLDFEPTGIMCFKLEHAPWCEDGTIVVLSSAAGLRVLTPGQAYYGNVRGSRGPMTLLPIARAGRPGNPQIVRNWTDNQTDICLTLKSPGEDPKAGEKVSFRLEKHKIVPIAQLDFQEAQAKVQNQKPPAK